MKHIDEYTVVDILNSYKKIIGADIEKVASLVFLDNSKKRRMFKEEMDGIMQEKGLDTKNDNYDKFREEIVFNEIVNNFSLNIDLNYDNEVKLALLSEIYRRFAKKMTEKEKREITDTILGEKNSYAIFKYDSEEYDGISDYAIITRYKEEKLKSVHNEVLRDCIKSAIEQTVEIDNIESVMKQGISEQIYNVIMEKLLIKFFLEDQRMDLKEFKNNSDNNSFNDILLENPEMEEEFKELLVDYFSNNLQYLDKNLLLLNSAALSILAVEMIKGRNVEELKLGNFDLDKEKSRVMAESISFIKDIYNEISKRKYDDVEYSIKTEEGEKIITVSKELISEFLSRCTKNDYLTDEDIEKIHQDILTGTLIEDIEKRRIANVNLDDLINANNSYEEKEEESLERDKILKSNIELVKYLVDEKITTNENLLDMYLQGNLNLKLITGIDMNELSEEYCSNKFKNLYYEMVFTQEPEKVKEIFERFAELYINLEKINKIGINRDELIGDIITVLGDQFAPEILSDLHEVNFVTLEKAVEWVGADIFFEEYKKGNLKPGEVRRFYEDKTIDLSGVANLINKLPDNGDKFMVIGSIFPEETEEDREIRDLLIDECLRIDSEIENNKVGNKRKEGGEKPIDYYKHITDPFARISLIKAFDEDYSFEMTSDGHAVVKLPNLKSVVIEKMLDKNKEPSYGASTFILDEEYYEKNSFRIKKDGKIDRQEILKDVEAKKVTKIIHLINSWGKNLENYFLDKQKPNWSKDKLNVIDEAIERVKRSDKSLMNKCNDQQLAKMILNLITTKKATLEQVQEIAQIYGVDLEKVMDSLEER